MTKLKLVANNPEKVSEDDPKDSEGYGGWRLNYDFGGSLWHIVGVTRVASEAPPDSRPDCDAFAKAVLKRLALYPCARLGITHGSNGDITIFVGVPPSVRRSVFKRQVVEMVTRYLKKYDIIRKPIIEELLIYEVK